MQKSSAKSTRITDFILNSLLPSKKLKAHCGVASFLLLVVSSDWMKSSSALHSFSFPHSITGEHRDNRSPGKSKEILQTLLTPALPQPLTPVLTILKRLGSQTPTVIKMLLPFFSSFLMSTKRAMWESKELKQTKHL